jgi:hypothetical protein
MTFEGGARLWAGLKQLSQMAGIRYSELGELEQGIVHVMAPELGITLPGATLICGDSHTCTNGGLGALAFGVGSSELTHALATQTLRQQKPKGMRVRFEGKLGKGVAPKDLILHLIGKIGASVGTGYAVEYAGEAIRAMSIDGRMTICNLSIELGSKIGFVAPDATTFEYVEGRRFAPKARRSKRPSRIGSRCPRTPTPNTRATKRSAPTRSRRPSPGEPAPSMQSRFISRCRTRPRRLTQIVERPGRMRWTIWPSRPRSRVRSSMSGGSEMKPFTKVTGPAASLLRANIDTDVIIRIERLTSIARDELGRYAFEALRYRKDGAGDPGFVLNRPAFRVAPILIAGANFGCGSSREGAVWA